MLYAKTSFVEVRFQVILNHSVNYPIKKSASALRLFQPVSHKNQLCLRIFFSNVSNKADYWTRTKTNGTECISVMDKNDGDFFRAEVTYSLNLHC